MSTMRNTSPIACNSCQLDLTSWSLPINRCLLSFCKELFSDLPKVSRKVPTFMKGSFVSPCTVNCPCCEHEVNVELEMTIHFFSGASKESTEIDEMLCCKKAIVKGTVCPDRFKWTSKKRLSLQVVERLYPDRYVNHDPSDSLVSAIEDLNLQPPAPTECLTQATLAYFTPASPNSQSALEVTIQLIKTTTISEAVYVHIHTQRYRRCY